MMQLLAKSWTLEIPTTKKDLNVQFKTIWELLVWGKYLNTWTGLAPHALQPGWSFCLPFPIPFKGVVSLLRINAGSHRGSPACGSYLNQNGGAWSQLSETATSCWCSNTPPPAYLGAFALAPSAAVWKTCPSTSLLCLLKCHTLFLRPSMK